MINNELLCLTCGTPVWVFTEAELRAELRSRDEARRAAFRAARADYRSALDRIGEEHPQ